MNPESFRHSVNVFQIIRNIYKRGSAIFYKLPLIMSSQDTLTSNQVKDAGGLKRSHENESSEEWVKRIQLEPASTSEDENGRIKLKKFVLLLSYCGKGYLGMQKNHGIKTIEDDLLNALFQADLIKKEGLSCPQLYRFQRAARTDKGVSAVKQVVSVKLPTNVDLPVVINEYLPEQIRVMKAVRVTQKFDSKTQCDARSYSYLCPTFAFAPNDKTDENYRISSEVMEELRNLFNKYKGTHNFHNFTARVKPNDRSANRYIMEFSCSEPFIRNEIEWILIKVKGQSFMLHQIRKMIGLAISICKRYVSEDIFARVWKFERIDIPIAPGVNLVLEEPHYMYYNKKYSNDGIHEQLNWELEEEKIQAFREAYIDKVIVDSEKNDKSMLNWLETLNYHTFNERDHETPGQRILNGKNDKENNSNMVKTQEKEKENADVEKEVTLNTEKPHSNDTENDEVKKEIVLSSEKTDAKDTKNANVKKEDVLNTEKT